MRSGHFYFAHPTRVFFKNFAVLLGFLRFGSNRQGIRFSDCCAEFHPADRPEAQKSILPLRRQSGKDQACFSPPALILYVLKTLMSGNFFRKIERTTGKTLANSGPLCYSQNRKVFAAFARKFKTDPDKGRFRLGLRCLGRGLV